MVLSLPSTGKPLTLLPTAHPELSLLLATTSSTLPAILTASPLALPTIGGEFTHLSVLSRPSASTIIIGMVVAHVNHDSRSVLYIAEITTPSKGVGMNLLLGTQGITSQYLTLAKTATVKSPEDILIQDLQNALATDHTKADTIWSNWMAKRNVKSPLAESTIKRILSVIFSSALKEEEVDGVKVVKKAGPYAGEIIRDLVVKGWVNNSMYPGGVVEAGLIPANDLVSNNDEERLCVGHLDNRYHQHGPSAASFSRPHTLLCDR
jgi:hypothetical protein